MMKTNWNTKINWNFHFRNLTRILIITFWVVWLVAMGYIYFSLSTGNALTLGLFSFIFYLFIIAVVTYVSYFATKYLWSKF